MYSNVFSLMITMKWSFCELPQLTNISMVVTLGNFLGFVDMKIMCSGLSPKLQMHLYHP